jgi:hypothetical protein
MTVEAGRPIFVVGCQRSGTTMLRLMLDSHRRISCGPETRFLADLERVVDTDWPRLSQYGYTQEEWLERIREFFGSIQADYAHGRGKERWADKTPRYALNIPFLLRVFPDAQIVHVIRDGRDVVVSHRKRFGYWSSVKSTLKWPRYIKTARGVGATLRPDQYHEVRYEDLAGRPEETMRDLLDFLGEEWDPQVLEFASKEHAVPARYHAQLAARQASAGTDQTVYASRVGTHRTELDPLTRIMLWTTSRRSLDELGYTGRSS